MDCKQFENEIQQQLDQRKSLELSEPADAHRLICEPCDSSWSMYQGLQEGFHFGIPADLPNQPEHSIQLTDRVMASLDSESDSKSRSQTNSVNLWSQVKEDDIPVAPISLPARKPNPSFATFKSAIISLSSVAALILVGLLISTIITPANQPNPVAKNTPKSSNGFVVKNDPQLEPNKQPSNSDRAQPELKSPGLPGNTFAFGQPNFQEFRKSLNSTWEDLDEQLKPYESARLTMETVPGVRLRIFPITGTLDILRQSHNMK